MSLPEGERQSPINIATAEVEFDTSVNTTPLTALYRSEEDVKLSNTGHSVQVSFKQRMGIDINIFLLCYFPDFKPSSSSLKQRQFKFKLFYN